MAQTVDVFPTYTSGEFEGLADVQYMPWYGNISGGWDVVPTMTSNSTPSGTVIVSTEYDSAHAGWKAFDGDNTTGWACQSGTVSTAYIGYNFAQATCVRKLFYLRANGWGTVNGIIQGSNDNNTWTDLTNSVAFADNVGGSYLDISNSNNYTYYRIKANSSTTPLVQFLTVQLYGVYDV